MASVSVDESKIEELLTRGVGEYIDPDGSFRAKLVTHPEKLVIKFGVDPTRPDIHLGHAVVLRKLRQFQDLGAKVIFLIGDFTAQIGDPTGKSKVRPEIDQAEVEKNMETYMQQVGKILRTDPSVFSWIRNSDWFTAITDLGFPPDQKVEVNIDDKKGLVDANSFIGKTIVFQETRMQIKDLKLSDISVITLRSFLWALKHLTHSRLIERDMFQDRINAGEELFLHEMMYPVLQGIDSHVLARIYGSCDLEVGGTDQTFNMIMGRDVMRMNQQPPQAVLSFELLVGTDGKEKMSKSLENYIAITDTPENMYGKILSLPDSLIVKYFELCTYTPMDDIRIIEKSLKDEKMNPKDYKMDLARQIVAEYHGAKKAEEAEKDWITKFQKKEIPDTVEVVFESGPLMPILVTKGLVESNSDARRLFESGAILDMTDNKKVSIKDDAISGHVYRIGKYKFIKIG